MKTKITMMALVTAGFLAFPRVAAQLPDAQPEPLANLGGEEFDSEYLRVMREHHRHGLEMARVAAERGQRPELVALAEQMARRLEQEIAEMTRLAARPTEARSGLGRSGAAAGAEPPPGRARDANQPTPTAADDLTGNYRETIARLRAVERDAFDALFLREMVRHHQAGFEMNQAAAGRAGDREVAAFARRSATQQQQEIAEMNDRYAEWYR